MAEFAFNPQFSETLDLSSVILQLSELGRCLKQYSLRRKRIEVYWLGSASSSNTDKRHLGTAKNVQSKEQERYENQAEIDLNNLVSHLCHGSFYWHFRCWGGEEHWGMYCEVLE